MAKVYVPIRIPASLLESAEKLVAERWPSVDSRSEGLVKIIEAWVNSVGNDGRHALTTKTLNIAQEIKDFLHAQHTLSVILLDEASQKYQEYMAVVAVAPPPKKVDVDSVSD